jgi:glutathione S-transferase
MYVLYVIPGSHACRAAMLMLEHKEVRYRRVDVVTLTHPVVVRLHGFDAGGQSRRAGKRRPLPLRVGDLLGTVPALAAGAQRISTNHKIARFLDAHHPDPPLLPVNPELRAEVEDAERWANDTLQMAARRILLPAVLRDPAGFSRTSADGRMGYLLYRSGLARRVICPWIGRLVFAVRSGAEDDEIARLPSLLDRVDGWIADGVIGGSELNVADFMIAPSLALILYRSEARPLFEGRPALEFVDRLLPEPWAVRDQPGRT